MDGILSAIKQLIQTATDFFQRALKAIEDFFKWAQDAFDYFWELLPVLPEYVFHRLVSGIVKFFQWLPVPDFFTQAVMRSSDTAVCGCISPMRFRLALRDNGPGAYLLRFILRRIPIIG
ncbi:hypothetical protein M2I83_16325 [Pseudomonas aeruginosa]|uniref:hypothetical protein n=1 Tax=Pseudomonas aeruginosa TaxID=287 RepID=UPI0024C03D4C|nr:hypothetical protein [Pseudomonas aeruginosa]WHV10207.1 hypothetical protein M2I83_16325 [Pseudomonas aeruginosa]